MRTWWYDSICEIWLWWWCLPHQLWMNLNRSFVDPPHKGRGERRALTCHNADVDLYGLTWHSADVDLYVLTWHDAGSPGSVRVCWPGGPPRASGRLHRQHGVPVRPPLVSAGEGREVGGGFGVFWGELCFSCLLLGAIRGMDGVHGGVKEGEKRADVDLFKKCVLRRKW